VVTVQIQPGSELDIRAVISSGARTNLSEARLRRIELTQVGGSFKLKPECIDRSARSSDHDAEESCCREWRVVFGRRARKARTASSRSRRSRVIYSLVSCNACEVGAGPAIVPVATQNTVVATCGVAHSDELRDARNANKSQQQQRLTPPRGYSTAAPTELRRMPTAPIEARRVRAGIRRPLRRPVRRWDTSHRRSTDRDAGDSGDSSPALVRRNDALPSRARAHRNHISQSGSVAILPRRDPEHPKRKRHPAALRTFRDRKRDRGTPPLQTPPTPPNAELVRQKPPSGPHATAAATRSQNDPATKDTEALIAEKVALLDRARITSSCWRWPRRGRRGSSHRVLRSRPQAASRSPRIAGISDEKRDAQRLFAQINLAFGVLTIQRNAPNTSRCSGRGRTSTVKAEEVKVEDLRCA